MRACTYTQNKTKKIRCMQKNYMCYTNNFGTLRVNITHTNNLVFPIRRETHLK